MTKSARAEYQIEALERNDPPKTSTSNLDRRTQPGLPVEARSYREAISRVGVKEDVLLGNAANPPIAYPTGGHEASRGEEGLPDGRAWAWTGRERNRSPRTAAAEEERGLPCLEKARTHSAGRR